jgi:hypothetical protein
MRYDITLKAKMLERYKELKQFPQLSWSEGIDSDKTLRYCIALIDEDSPLYKITDIETRIKKALELAGFKFITKKIPKDIQEMIDGHNENANEMLYVLMGLYHNPVFELWFSSKMSTHFMLRTLRTPPKDLNSKQMADEAKTRVAIEKELNSIINEQLSRESKIFRDDEMKKRMASIVMQKIIPYPEQYAEENV